MATGVSYPTTDHIAGEFTTGVHERADGQDVDPVAIRREQLLAELEALGIKQELDETPEQRAERIQAELAAMDQGQGPTDEGGVPGA